MESTCKSLLRPERALPQRQKAQTRRYCASRCWERQSPEGQAVARAVSGRPGKAHSEQIISASPPTADVTRTADRSHEGQLPLRPYQGHGILEYLGFIATM